MMSAMCGRLDLRVSAKGRLAVMAGALFPRCALNLSRLIYRMALERGRLSNIIP